MKKIKSPLLLGLSLLAYQASSAAQVIHYHHRPLFIHLKPGVERWVNFPGRVQIDARGSGLKSSQIRLLNNQGTLYLRAYQPFDRRRLLIHLIQQKQTLLMDIQSDAQGSSVPIRVVLGHKLISSHAPSRTQKKKSHIHRTISLVALMRAGIQAVYFHKPSSNGLHLLSSTVSPTFNPSTLPAELKQRHLKITRIEQWQTADLPKAQITALHLENTGSQPIQLSLKSLALNAQAASFYPETPLNEKHSKTILFLITREPHLQ